MPNKMLIDASHPEETRVVVLRGSRIEEFDFESQDKKQLRGNIYLARVTRVEPSLQAAFVEYGGNRHGFLAFNEIHPDYYQIPVADRQALLRAEAEEARAEDENGEEEDEREERGRGKRRRRAGKSRRGAERKAQAGEDEAAEASGADEETEGGKGASVMTADAAAESVSEDTRRYASARSGGNDSDSDGEVDTVGAEDALDEAQHRRRPVRRNYKIQEVIKRRQILLVQVVKEERGNKGAALTTYLSLAGRYSVLMPNTARGGGISRKITNPADRKRLKEIVRELEVPEGMGVILRTAGANRTKAEIKRDYDYLMRLWERVRNLTLNSTAPALVYEEGSLIKRSVRDLYNKDIDQILVAGEEGYREAKDFMRMLMPSHAKVVQPYRDTVPIFARNGIEAQLDRMLQPQVTLKSGGYIIINQTEALVAIDVNSGRSTKEHSIEDTALQTNLEAAEEVARQLRLRDLAGLIVIDFIDMEENRNNRTVEKRLKECLKHDRARIQVGRISHFGLLEMSRQRIRTSVLESTMQPCPHCGGTGHVRSESSVALLVVRAIEEYLLKDAGNDITVRTPPSTALYVLNYKRANLTALEEQFGVNIAVEADETVGSQHYVVDKGPPSDRPGTIEHGPLQMDIGQVDEEDDSEAAEADGDRQDADEQDGGRERKKRRRRRRRGGRDRDKAAGEEVTAEAAASEGEEAVSEPGEDGEAREADDSDAAADQESRERKKRRRGKRGGKRNRRDEETGTEPTAASESEAASELAETAQQGEAAQSAEEAAPMAEAGPSGESEPAVPQDESEPAVPQDESEPAAVPEKPRRKSARRTKEDRAKTQPADIGNGLDPVPEPEQPASAEEEKREAKEGTEQEEAPKPRRARKRRKTGEEEPAEPAAASPEGEPQGAPRKTGWWQRKGFF